ncbi:MAG TPA: zf-HC2 domain-containing protein [Thermoanaerobaculia bacterium]|nr:zf-HC2 domain-containing protein [Thermoanaerobaculia bacterium]
MNERSERSDQIGGGRGRRRTGHEEVWDLLPWYVNGTLDEGETLTVEEHLEACGICREEVRYWRGFARALQDEGDLAVSADAGLARLRGRLAGAGASPPHRPPRGAAGGRAWRDGIRRTPTPVRWALAAQLAAVLLMGGLLASSWSGAWTRPRGPAPSETAGPTPAGATAPAAGTFRTLSDAPAAPAAWEATLLRVVFADQTREREIRGALIAVGGRIVDGPSPTGVYTVAVEASGDPEAVLRSLRSFSQVLFAERSAASAATP